MKYLSHILCLLLILVAGCNTSKKVSSTTIQSTRDSVAHFDSSARETVKTIRTGSDTNTHTTLRDSVIDLGGKTVEDSVGKEDLEVPRTKNGTAVPRRFEKKENGVRAWAVIDTNGNLRYGCEVDSYKIVVRNLMRERVQITNTIDSLVKVIINTNSTKAHTSESVTKQETVIVKQKSWWGRNWKLLVIGAVLLVLIVLYIINKLKNKATLLP